MNRSWNLQICQIQDKGYKAFQDGIPLSDCPYKSGYRNQNGVGGQLQRQRREAWVRGWLTAQKGEERKQSGK